MNLQISLTLHSAQARRISRLVPTACFILCAFALAFGAEQAVSDTTQVQTTSPRPSDHWCSPGDAVQVLVFPDHEEFPNGLYHIDGKGDAFFPIIGDIDVMRLSQQELVDSLKSAYLDYLRHPNNLQVRPVVRVSLTGGFAQPGLYYIDPSMSMWDVIRKAGGVVREDGLKKIRWERGEGVYKKDLIPDLESGKSLYQIGFRSGDRIWVTDRPRRRGWEVFRTEVLPMITFALSSVLTSITVYQFYQTLQDD